MKKNFLFIALICCALSVCAQSKLSTYTRSFLLDARLDTRDNRLDTQETRSEARDAEMISAFVHFNEGIDAR